MMNPVVPRVPPVLGLFQKRFEGDDALLELARRRFEQAGLGAEMYASTPEELEWMLRFRPAVDAPLVAHLPRGINLLNESGRALIAEFAARFAGRVHGLVMHDQPALAAQPEDYLRAARELGARLERIKGSPWLFIEYAEGLDPEVFAHFFGEVRELQRVSAAIDSGHVGIRQARHAYAPLHPGEDVCALKPSHPKLPAVIRDVETSVRSALPAVLQLIETVARFGKPVHFHLHDGHPASTFSPFGVSDHLSFLAEIPIPFAHEGRRALPTMFGPDGLKQIAQTAVRALGTDRVSFTLEIHPTGEQLPLNEAAELFSHWRDRTNAEKMNHWLDVLARHAVLLARIGDTRPP